MSAGKLKYTLIVRHPDTDVPTALLVGEGVPSWASDLVHKDDLVGGSDTGSDDDAAKAAEAAAAAEKAAADAAAEAEATRVAAEKAAEEKAAADKAEADAAAAAGHPVGEPSATWKVAELEAYATAKKVDISSATNNAGRVEALKAAAAAGSNQ